MDNILLLDGKNTAYRALFASRGDMHSKVHPFVVWLRFANVWLEKFRPIAVHVFWDCPKNKVWRKKVLPEYKDHRETMRHYDDDVQSQMRSLIRSAARILPYMNVRQYMRRRQECDDLIYAAARVLTPSKTDAHKVIVVSSDSDFTQLAWHMPHVAVYEPKSGKFMKRPDCDPVLQKALSGDKADNIDGFRGIGPVKGRRMVMEPPKLFEFIDAVGRAKLKRNIALIDLSMNPSNISNILYVMKSMHKEIEFSKDNINKIAIEERVRGLMAEYPKLANSFNRLA